MLQQDDRDEKTVRQKLSGFLPGCAVTGSSALCSTGGRRSMYANTQPPLVPAHREGALCEPTKKMRTCMKKQR